MDDFSLANQLLILSAGRRPAWRAQTVSDDVLNPPAAASDGVALSDAVVAGVRIDLREDVAFRTVRVTFPTVTSPRTSPSRSREPASRSTARSPTAPPSWTRS